MHTYPLHGHKLVFCGHKLIFCAYVIAILWPWLNIFLTMSCLGLHTIEITIQAGKPTSVQVSWPGLMMTDSSMFKHKPS